LSEWVKHHLPFAGAHGEVCFSAELFAGVSECGFGFEDRGVLAKGDL
jgi:hypothetical protein